MNEKRREIIVREIEYWKRSRLLPEHYCDYLLALYTEGDQAPFPSSRRHSFAWGRAFFILTICILLPLSVLVIYFTELSFVLQMLLLSFFMAICAIGIWMWKREGKLVHLPLVSGAFLLFLTSIRASDYYFPNMPAASGAAIFVNTLLWLIAGLRFRFLYFTISGLIGLLLLAASFFF